MYSSANWPVKRRYSQSNALPWGSTQGNWNWSNHDQTLMSHGILHGISYFTRTYVWLCALLRLWQGPRLTTVHNLHKVRHEVSFWKVSMPYQLLHLECGYHLCTLCMHALIRSHYTALTHIWSCVAALVAGSKTAGWVVLRMDPSPERSESRKWSSGTWGEYDWMWLNFELSLYFRSTKQLCDFLLHC